MKIIELRSENIKRLKAVTIRPNGDVIQVTGKNGQGKTSVLDSMWWAIKGGRNIQAQPIREGQETALIRLDLGEVKITRHFTRSKADKNEFTTTLVVEKASGAPYPKPQTMLDSLVSELSFDPLDFARADPKKQFDTLRQFVPGVNFEDIADADLADRNKRRDKAAEAERLKAAAAVIAVPETLPAAVDEEALLKRLTEAGEHNTGIERLKSHWQDVGRRILQWREAAGVSRRDAEQIDAKLAKEIERLTAQAAVEKKSLIEAADKLEASAIAAETQQAEADPIPEPIDANQVRAELDAGKAANQVRQAAARKAQLEQEAAAAATAAEEFTARIKAREEAKQKAIAAAEMPVEGIGFGDKCVLLNGLPFDQASDRERIRVSCAVAMKQNPKLRVIRTRGNDLDDDGMKVLAELAETNDMQVWVERVQAADGVGMQVIIEDGMVKTPAPAQGELV